MFTNIIKDYFLENAIPHKDSDVKVLDAAANKSLVALQDSFPVGGPTSSRPSEMEKDARDVVYDFLKQSLNGLSFELDQRHLDEIFSRIIADIENERAFGRGE